MPLGETHVTPLERHHLAAPQPRLPAHERLHLTSNGQVRLSLRQPWRDGTTDLVFDPVEFLGRLAVLVPRPRTNLLLSCGVLGARSAWRAEVVRCPKRPTRKNTELGTRPEGHGEAAVADAGKRTADVRWAALMQRTFGFDVLACDRCGGRLRFLALIQDPVVIGRILSHLGLPTDVPRPRPSRARPIPKGFGSLARTGTRSRLPSRPAAEGTPDGTARVPSDALSRAAGLRCPPRSVKRAHKWRKKWLICAVPASGPGKI